MSPGLTAAADDGANQHNPAAMTVFKSPYCGCCGKWVEYIRSHGFDVTVRDTDNLDMVKKTAGIPGELGSCHTAAVGGYAIEGHVPVEAIGRLLREDRKIRGLAVPGMPQGSPGMEGPRSEPYTVYSFSGGGQREVFMSVPAQ